MIVSKTLKNQQLITCGGCMQFGGTMKKTFTQRFESRGRISSLSITALLLTELFFSLDCHAQYENDYAQIGIDVSSAYVNRGYSNSADVRDIFVNFSAYGFSTTVRIIDGPQDSESLSEVSISYSYSAGFADIDFGVSSREFPHPFQMMLSEEFFLELRGNPEWNGTLPFEIIPSLKQSFGLNSKGGNFTELKLEKEIVGEKYNLLFNPFLELGAGEFYTDSWDLNHIEIGADLSWEFSNGFYLSPYYSIIKPLAALKEATGDDASESRYGVQLRYKF